MARGDHTRDLVSIFSENERRWRPRWKDLPRTSKGCYNGDASLDDELIELDETDEDDESED